MHPFLILGSLLHATALAVIGFFVLFTADRAGGRVKTIGNALGIWLFILAALAIIAAIVAPARGYGPGPGAWGWMGGHHRPMMGSYPQGWPPSELPAAVAQNEAAPADAPAAAAAK